MSGLGDWLYYKKKYRLWILPKFISASKQKTMLALSYQHNWELPTGWSVNYFDINSSLSLIPSPDIVVEREFNDGKAEYGYLYDHALKNVTPKIFWFIDAHVSDAKRIRYCNHFDLVFVAQSSYIPVVKSISTCKNVFWLPLCFPNPVADISQNVQEKTYPVSFIGTVGKGYKKRNEMISFLQQEYGSDFFVTTSLTNPKELMQQSKVTTNQSIKDDLNFRVFEALGYGAELVTNTVPDIDKIEGLSDRLHCFRDYAELKQDIDKLLAGDLSYLHNMAEVQEWIKRNHTMKNRLSEMLKMVDTCKQVQYK